MSSSPGAGRGLYRPRLESLKGVASATAWGGRVREVQVDVDRAKLEATNLSLDKISQAVRAGHMDLPGGSLKTAQKAYGVRTLGVRITSKTSKKSW